MIRTLSELIVGKIPVAGEPIVFVDFDGVINFYDSERDCGPGDAREAVLEIPAGTPPACFGGESSPLREPKKVRVRWRPSVCDAIRGLNAVWLTSWKRLTQELLNPLLGLDFGYVDWQYRGFSDYGGYGKLDGLRSVVDAAGSPFAVVDDSAWWWGDSIRDGYREDRFTCIVPDPGIGMSDDDVRALLAFIGRRKETALEEVRADGEGGGSG